MGRIPAELQPYVNRLTGWQRNQWAKAGYPVEVRAVQRYARMRKPEFRMQARSRRRRRA
jgi:hypothetical protein